MNLASTLLIYAGGPGSGCNPSTGNCGRPKSEESTIEDWKRLMTEHDRLVDHPWRLHSLFDEAGADRQYKMQKVAFRNLVDGVESAFGTSTDFPTNLSRAKEFLDKAENEYAAGKLRLATGSQEVALSLMHSILDSEKFKLRFKAEHSNDPKDLEEYHRQLGAYLNGKKDSK